VAALTQGRGRRQWHGQILCEGRCSEGWGGRNGNGGGGALLAVCFGGRMEEGKERGVVASGGTLFKQCRGKQRKGGPWRGTTRGRREWGALSRPAGDSTGGAAWSARGRRRGL
jgi:hypothetical protein